MGDRDVGVAEFIARIADHFLYGGKQFLAVDAFPALVGVGKMRPDVAQRKGAQQGVAQGMDGDVAVGMGDETLFAVDPVASQPHGQAFPQGVHIISVSDPHGRIHCSHGVHRHKGTDYFQNCRPTPTLGARVW